MGFNQISVVTPRSDAQPRKEKKSDIDKVLEGLQVANGVLGIGVNVQAIRDHQANIEGKDQEQKLADVKAMDEATDRSNAITGTFNKPQQATLLKGLRPAKEGEAPELTGIDSATGGPLNYVKERKAPVIKVPKTREIDTIESGQHVKKIVPDEAGAVYPAYNKPEKDTSGKDAAADEKLGRELAYKINPSLGRAGELGRTQARINAAGRALTLGLHEDGTVRNLTKPEIGELASSVAAMVANGSVAGQHAIDSMTPQSLWGNLQAQEAYLTNDVREADMQPFVQRLVDTAKREQATSMKAKTDAQAQVIPAFHDWRERNPEAWARTVRAAGLSPDDFDADSNYAPQAKGAAGGVSGAAPAAKAGPAGGGSGTATAAPAPPKPGDTHDGFVFQGGDPADQKNWKQLGAPLKGAQ